jgi:hypothetical protein
VRLTGWLGPREHHAGVTKAAAPGHPLFGQRSQEQNVKLREVAERFVAEVLTT